MNKLDHILYETLTEDDHPSEMLNRHIMKKAGMEENKMKRNKRNLVAAAAVILCIAAGGSTAYAAYRYLTSSEIADSVSENSNLAAAFESKDAIRIDEVQTSGEFSFHLLGIVTGSDLEPYLTEDSKSEIDDKKTYITMAISKLDGSSMPERNFCISPLIGGVPFDVANNSSLGTELIWFEKDGVIYELVSCDNLEMFADRGVWISVVDNFGNEAGAYTLNEDGSYTKNPSYEDFSALFQIPFDASKADRETADRYLENILEKTEADENENTENDTEYSEFLKKLQNMSADEINREYDEVKAHTVTAKPDETGYIDFTYTEDDITCGTRGDIHSLIPDDKDFVVTDVLGDENGVSGFDTITRNEDGSFTCKEYKIKQ